MACAEVPPPPGQVSQKTAERKMESAPVFGGLQRIRSDWRSHRNDRRIGLGLRIDCRGHHVIGEKGLIEIGVCRFRQRRRPKRGHRDPISATGARHNFSITDKSFVPDAASPSFASSKPSAPCDRRHASTASRKPAPGGPVENQNLRTVAPPPDHAPWPAAILPHLRFHQESPNADTPGGPGRESRNEEYELSGR